MGRRERRHGAEPGDAGGRDAASERNCRESAWIGLRATEMDAKGPEPPQEHNTIVGGEPIVVVWRAGTVSAVNASSIPDSKDIGAAVAFDRRIGGRTLTFEATSDETIDQQTGSGWDITGRAISGPLTETQLRPVLATDSFWFDWAAFHPETSIYRQT